MTTSSSAERARQIALTLLADRQHPNESDIDDAVAASVAALGQLSETVDGAALRRRLEADVSVFVGQGAVLEDDDSNHRPWLDARRGAIDWRFWDAYREWSLRRLPRDVVRGMDRMTDDILGHLEDPQREGRWDRRGMVVGQVQSGKTSNYTGLICKAADAGYKFIVVLTGLHNSLRSQTQRRLDEGFLGLDSRTSLAFDNTNRAIGVGAGGRRQAPAYTLTSSDERGDFARGVAQRIAGRIGSDPVLLVVKKNRSILTNLIEWVTTINGLLDPESGRMVVSEFPLLVIDDEADNASVNTKQVDRETQADGTIAETDPSAINMHIRRLLHAFERSSFVAYTATPFANIFIDEEQPSPSYGGDLFPRSFILRIPPPTNYMGPAEVFGVPAAEDPEGVARPGLPVLRTLEDHESWLQTGHKIDAAPGRLPTSLKEAIRAFFLVCAARSARGQENVHNSMLVHVTRFVAVQSQVRDQIQGEVETLTDRILGRGGNADTAELLSELQTLWEEDFIKTSARMPEELRGAPVSWREVSDHLPVAVARIKVLEINGTARDALTYTDQPDGISLIVVGGDKLSRGLTLEGLSVSYYLRASKMYDTLMQMGRWFGFREGYTDLLRLYTTGELQEWYRDITVANEELGHKFDEMARVGSNPRDFSLYVRKSPAGLLVTARAKMRSGRTMELTFSGDVVETIGFQRDSALQRDNLDHVEKFLLAQTAAGRHRTGEGHPKWADVPGDEVASLLESFATVDGAKKARGRLLARYIRGCVADSELTEWTVVVVHNSQAGDQEIALAGERVGLTTRSYYRSGQEADDQPDIVGDYTIRRLGDPKHESLDLDESGRQEAESLRSAAEAQARQRAAAQGIDPEKVKSLAVGPFVRRVRPITRGLLVVYCLNPNQAQMPEPVDAIPGLLVSFPESPGAPAISYEVPRRYWEQEAM
jgi:Z1 domain